MPHGTGIGTREHDQMCRSIRSADVKLGTTQYISRAGVDRRETHCSEIGPTPGLRKRWSKAKLAAQDPRQEHLLLRVGPPRENMRRRGFATADAVARAAELLFNNELIGDRAAPAAPLGRPGDPSPLFVLWQTSFQTSRGGPCDAVGVLACDEGSHSAA